MNDFIKGKTYSIRDIPHQLCAACVLVFNFLMCLPGLSGFPVLCFHYQLHLQVCTPSKNL